MFQESFKNNLCDLLNDFHFKGFVYVEKSYASTKALSYFLLKDEKKAYLCLCFYSSSNLKAICFNE